MSAPIRLTFASFTAFCDYALGEGHVSDVNKELYARHYTGRERSASVVGFTQPLPDVKRLLLSGWPEGVTRMRETIAKITLPPIRSVRRKGAWRAMGDSLSLDRMYSGAVDSMFRTTTRAARVGPVRVRIVATFGGGSSLRADEMFFRGAAATALAEVLCAAGYAVEIVGAIKAIGSFRKSDMRLAVTAKAYEAPLSLTAIAAALAHISAFRRIGFAAIIRACGTEKCNSHLGKQDKSATVEELIGPLTPGERVLFVPGSVTSAPHANTWVARAVAALERGEDIAV